MSSQNMSSNDAYPGEEAALQAALVNAAEWEGYAIKLEVIIAGCPQK